MQENTNVKSQEALRPLILEFDEVKWLKKEIFHPWQDLSPTLLDWVAIL